MGHHAVTDLLRTFLETLAAAQREGWADKLALWVFVLVTLAAALWAIRTRERTMRALEAQYQDRIADLELRLAGCEGKHGQQEEASERMRQKIERIATLLLTSMPASDLQKAFVELMIDPPFSKEVQGLHGPAANG